MPTPLEIVLWKNLDQNKFDTVQSLLQDNPELVKSIGPGSRGGVPETLLDAAVEDQDFSTIKSLKDNLDFILCNDVLTYDVADKGKMGAERSHRLAIRSKKPNQERINEKHQEIEKWKYLVSLIRDITILHAIATDNADLIDRLEKSGADPLGTLGDFAGKTLVGFLIKAAKNPKICAWRTMECDKAVAESKASSARAQAEMDRNVEEEKARIHAEYEAQRLEILAQAAKGREKSSPTARASQVPQTFLSNQQVQSAENKQEISPLQSWMEAENKLAELRFNYAEANYNRDLKVVGRMLECIENVPSMSNGR